MSSGTICKIVRQYNKLPIQEEDMYKLQEIARDYAKVKNYVYQRYGGVYSLSKLYPGYTVQNEMTHSGLREELGLPSVYFYLAIFDALGDIKNQWIRTKSMVLKAVNRNGSLTEEEKHFLRYLLKVNQVFDAVLSGVLPNLPKDMEKKYVQLTETINIQKLENYLRRQVRKYHIRPHTYRAEGFSVSERAYRYGDHGIYISVKEKRKRIFIPLTDGNSYTRQMYIRLFPEEAKLELQIPINVAAKKHPEYDNRVGISFGMITMIVTNDGHTYGEELGNYQRKLSDWLREQNTVYNRNREANLGRKKYYAKKQRLEEQLHNYINRELNRFLREEKPAILYVPRLPEAEKVSKIQKVNYYVSTWQRGYIRERLELKCREQSVELIEVLGKDISRECSCCGTQGIQKERIFICSQCGYQVNGKQNAAQNAKKRGERS